VIAAPAQPRCTCGAWIHPCSKCGRVPGSHEPDVFDWRPTPPRLARIDARARELFGWRTAVDRFIDKETGQAGLFTEGEQ